MVAATKNTVAAGKVSDRFSQILISYRDNTEEAKNPTAVINKAVMLIGGNKDNTIFRYLSFSLLTYRYPPSGKNKYLMFPRVFMGWSEGAGRNIKDTHTEVRCSIISVNNLALNYPG